MHTPPRPRLRAITLLLLVAVVLPGAPLAAEQRRAGAGAGDTAAEDVQAHCEHLTPAGDLDGDGIADLIGHSRRTDDYANECRPLQHHVVGRRGADGAALWSRAIAPAASVTPAQVGLDAGDGVLVTTPGPGNVLPWQPAGNATLNILALDGDGSMLWSRDVAGALPYGGLEVGHLSAPPQLLDAVAGPADDVLVGTRSRSGTTTAITAIVVDGATGVARPVFTHTGAGDDARLLAAPDVSGDGLDDVVVVTTNAGTATLVARAGTDGREVWRATRVPLVADGVIRRVDDTDADGVAEVLYGNAAQRMGGGGAVFTLLDGATGRTRWAVEAWLAHDAGDVDGDGARDVGLLLGRSGGGSWLQHDVLDGAGRVLRTSAVGGDLDPDATGGARVSPVAESAGDVDGDGLTGISSQQYTADGTLRWTFQGSDGAMRWTRKMAVGGRAHVVLPARASIDGVGDDAVSLRPLDEHTVLVEAIDGADGDVVWSTTIALRTFHSPQLMAAADLDGDDRADVLVSGRPTDDQRHVPVMAISGADGAVLWQR